MQAPDEVSFPSIPCKKGSYLPCCRFPLILLPLCRACSLTAPMKQAEGMAGWAGAAVGAAGMAAAAQGGAEGAAERCVRSLTHQSSPCLPFNSHRPQIGSSCPTFLLLHCREQALLRAAGGHSRLCAIHRKNLVTPCECDIKGSYILATATRAAAAAVGHRGTPASLLAVRRRCGRLSAAGPAGLVPSSPINSLIGC